MLTTILIFALSQGIQIKSGASTDTATVNTQKSLLVVRGASTLATYSCSASGLVTTAAYTMQLDSEVARGFKIQKICIGSSAATAAALQTVVVQRRTTASTVGTAATAEGTATPSVSRFDPNDSTWAGRCAVTPTLGTAGAILDQFGWTVPEIGAGAADPASQPVFCKQYGDESEKAPLNLSGTANGISVSVSAAGAGGLAAGSISILFTSVP
jgi:hypothetical protein